MKECSICHVFKPFSYFNKHVNMKDGHFKMCKECQKLISKANYSKNKREIDKTTKKYVSGFNRRAKYPEKYLAGKAIIKLKKEPGFHFHHWSYNENHWKDVIKLPIKAHL